MSAHMAKAVEVAARIQALVEDGLRGLDRTVIAWPAEFRAIVWEAVAEIASRRAETARREAGGS